RLTCLLGGEVFTKIRGWGGNYICECISQCSRDGLQAIGSRASFAVPDYRQIGEAGGTDHLRISRRMQP
ncbi:MAG: hypothetical protein RSB78_03405, partial [Oscillospiraceae bacterium]